IKSKKKFAKIVEYSKKKIKHIPPKEYVCYEVNKDFRFFSSLSALLFDFPSFDRKELLDKFQNIGRIKLFLISGVFLGDEKARADILFVGETINSKSVDLAVSNIIADYGLDLKVVLYDLEEFEYRIKMFDKFIKDIFKFKHEIILNHTKII
ncbi:MAG: hypothetical protein ORN26_00650, partial [Candidatus Pacebacteria bacterium]|nr:hypothetical protein [Candidatus Paceibacterota bacterium]